jgi:VanZ family protein
MLNIFKGFYKTIIVSIIIFILSALPGSTFKEVNISLIPFQDKFVHLSFYLGLSFILLLDYYYFNHYKITNNKVIILLFFFTILYGGIIELLQGILFKERSAEWLDFIANSIGSIIGTIIFFILKKFKILQIKDRSKFT